MRSATAIATILGLSLLTGPALGQPASSLLEEATREGRLVWYTSMSVDDSQPLLDAFTRKYPFVKAELFRASTEKLLNKILAETRAGKFFFDVVAISAFEARILQNQKLLQPYVSPESRVYPKEFKDPEGYWVDLYDNYYVIGYNTRLVSKADAPTDWNDLLHPRWKGKFAMDPEEYEWYAGLQQAWGAARAREYGRALAAQNLLWRKGHTLIANLLAAGEFPLGIVFAHRIEELKQKKAPVDWVSTSNPIPVSLHPVSIAAKAPNPSTARLFVDFVVSAEGQSIMRDLSRLPAHPQVTVRWSMDRTALKLLPVDPTVADRANQLVKEFKEIFNPPGQ